MDKKDLRPSTMSVICYLIAIILILVAVFNAINSYQTMMTTLMESGYTASDEGVFQMVLGYTINQSMIAFSLGVLFACIGAMNQRIYIQHKELMYRLSKRESKGVK